MTPDEHERASQDYRAAKAAVGAHRIVQHKAAVARVQWLQQHPVEGLYDPQTGAPIHPELAELTEAVAKAAADVEWCRGLVIACAEVVKGHPYDEGQVA